MVEHTKSSAQSTPSSTRRHRNRLPSNPQAVPHHAGIRRAHNASDEGRKADPAAKVLGQMVLNELHDMLHWLVVAPAHFDRYRDLWNRFCDEQNAPQHKIAKPKTPQHRREGPF